MRVGMNPNREESIGKRLPPAVPVVAVTVHLPNTYDHYHEGRWEIVTKSLTLARRNAGMEHHFVVWDNGSCEKMREWLFYEFKPDKLMFTENIGVFNTMRRLFGMFHDSVIAYSNDDILHYPDWLPEQVHILQSFPNVATVSGCVTRFYSGKADDATLRWATDNATVKKAFTPSEWDYQHGASIGKPRNVVDRIYRNTAMPYVEYNDSAAMIGGNHCQIVGYAQKLYPFTYHTTRYMEPLFQGFDVKINDAGMLRLLTTTRRTRHLGNVLSDDDRIEIQSLLVESETR